MAEEVSESKAKVIGILAWASPGRAVVRRAPGAGLSSGVEAA